MDETDEIAAALFDRIVWQTVFVNRQNNEESDPVAGPRLQRQFLRGRQHVAVSRAFERLLADAAVGQIQPFHQTHTDFFRCVVDRKIFRRGRRRFKCVIPVHRTDPIAVNALLLSCLLVDRPFFVSNTWDPGQA